MKPTALAAAAAAFLAAAPALAQTEAAPGAAQDQTAGATAEMPAEIRQEAQAYVEGDAMQSALDDLLSTDSFVAQLRATGLQLDPEETQTLAGIVDEEFADVRPELEEAMTFAAAEAFTMEELQAMNEFYGSPEGRSIAAKMQPFMQAFYDQISPTLRETQGQIAARAQEALGSPGGAEETAPEGGAPQPAD